MKINIEDIVYNIILTIIIIFALYELKIYCNNMRKNINENFTDNPSNFERHFNKIKTKLDEHNNNIIDTNKNLKDTEKEFSSLRLLFDNNEKEMDEKMKKIYDNLDPTKNYKKMGNYKCNDRNDIDIYRSNLAGCVSNCKNNNKCISFTFKDEGNGLGTCGLSSSCYPGNAEADNLENPFILYMKNEYANKVPPNSLSQFNLLKNNNKNIQNYCKLNENCDHIELINEKIEKFENKNNNLENCLNKCINNDECIYVSYNNNNCELYKKKEEKEIQKIIIKEKCPAQVECPVAKETKKEEKGLSSNTGVHNIIEIDDTGKKTVLTPFIEIIQHTNFKGERIGFRESVSDIKAYKNENNRHLDDNISSLKMLTKYKVILFEDRNYEGRFIVINKNDNMDKSKDDAIYISNMALLYSNRCYNNNKKGEHECKFRTLSDKVSSFILLDENNKPIISPKSGNTDFLNKAFNSIIKSNENYTFDLAKLGVPIKAIFYDQKGYRGNKMYMYYGQSIKNLKDVPRMNNYNISYNRGFGVRLDSLSNWGDRIGSVRLYRNSKVKTYVNSDFKNRNKKKNEPDDIITSTNGDMYGKPFLISSLQLI